MIKWIWHHWHSCAHNITVIFKYSALGKGDGDSNLMYVLFSDPCVRKQLLIIPPGDLEYWLCFAPNKTEKKIWLFRCSLCLPASCFLFLFGDFTFNTKLLGLQQQVPAFFSQWQKSHFLLMIHCHYFTSVQMASIVESQKRFLRWITMIFSKVWCWIVFTENISISIEAEVNLQN